MNSNVERLPAFAKSKALYERAKRVLPSGVTHDMRFHRPFPIYIQRSNAAHKWDTDGNRYIDYWMGHGALLLGHGHPEVIAAVNEAVQRMTHAGGCHELEVEWAERVVQLVPSAEKVRFTSSGTEATMLAMRLARAATSRDRIVKFEGHFHGWHDYATFGVNPPFDRPTSLGIPAALGSTVTVLPVSLEMVERDLSRQDVAAVILEPTGASMGLVPISVDFLRGLRELCDRTRTTLIFDEVITGFRFAPGGVQAITGVLPDLTTLGKVLAGGFPGGAVAGRAEIMDLMAVVRNEFEGRVPHTGTFNANPVSAAAGITALKLVADGRVGQRAAELGEMLRSGLSAVVRRRGVAWTIFGESSVFHWLPISPDKLNSLSLGGSEITSEAERRKSLRAPTVTENMRTAMLERGVDFPGYEGWMSAAHTEGDVELTIEAFDGAIQQLGG